MANKPNFNDRLRAFLVIAATAGMIYFNWSAATGRLGGVDMRELSAMYPTILTPATYAFSIWSLIYIGMIAFSIYQFLPSNLVKYRDIRLTYIVSCLLNCTWIYVWVGNQIALSFGVIIALASSLFLINYRFIRTNSYSELWLVKNPFGLYFGWVTAASFVNFAVLLKYLNVEMSITAENIFAIAVVLIAGVCALAARIKLLNYIYPLAVAWALTAIAINQTGRTALMVVAAFTVIGCLVISASFVMTMPTAEEKLHKS